MKHHEKLNFPHAVYRVYDGENVLLYVGYSFQPFSRIEAHRFASSWYRTAVKVTLTWYPGWFEAARAEAEAIAAEKPLSNRMCVDPEAVGLRVIRKKTSRKPKGDGVSCPRCGKPKEKPHTTTPYCTECAKEYRREYRAKKILESGNPS